MRQAVARPRHKQSVCIHNMHVALVCSGPPQKRGHMWLNKVASVLGPLDLVCFAEFDTAKRCAGVHFAGVSFPVPHYHQLPRTHPFCRVHRRH